MTRAPGHKAKVAAAGRAMIDERKARASLFRAVAKTHGFRCTSGATAGILTAERRFGGTREDPDWIVAVVWDGLAAPMARSCQAFRVSYSGHKSQEKGPSGQTIDDAFAEAARFVTPRMKESEHR